MAPRAVDGVVMAEQVALRGSSWDHPRGHAPARETAAAYARASGARVSVDWVPRSLKAFGVDVVETLARDYDLILIDHPHVGTAAESGSLVPLEEYLGGDAAVLAEASPGRSFESYEYGGHLWALPVDAACQVACWRPDLLEEPPETWEDVTRLAESGRVLWPLGDVDAAASFLTLTAQAGHPCGEAAGAFAHRPTARWALELLGCVAATSDPRCRAMNPIAVLDTMASCDDVVYSPLLFGYVNYSRLDAPGRRVRFGDPPAQAGGRSGALLGGVGIAVSSRSAQREVAVDYARFVASPEIQRGLYFDAGGQPAHASAWNDPEVDRKAGGFFSGTARAMQGAWTRPRYPRFAEFQTEMIALFGDFSTRPVDALLDELEERYARLYEEPG